MLATSHTLVGTMIGANRIMPVPAFLLGVLSHLLLDLVPHWGGIGHDAFIFVARLDGVAVLLTFAALLFAWIKKVFETNAALSVLAGAFGGLVLDLNKPFNHFFGFSPFPGFVDSFHSRFQNEAPSRLTGELLFLGVLLAATPLWFKYKKSRAGTHVEPVSVS